MSDLRLVPRDSGPDCRRFLYKGVIIHQLGPQRWEWHSGYRRYPEHHSEDYVGTHVRAYVGNENIVVVPTVGKKDTGAMSMAGKGVPSTVSKDTVIGVTVRTEREMRWSPYFLFNLSNQDLTFAFAFS
jgi:hypothetical protein